MVAATAPGAERTSCPNGYFGLAVPQAEAEMRLKDFSNLRGSSDTIWGFFYLARDNDSAAS